MGMDHNNGWWPIAWGVAETESYAQWKWFLDHLDDDLELFANSLRFVFMSDQQKGLGMVIVEKFPQSEHRYCVQYIFNNFKKRFLGESLKDDIWEMSSSTTVEEFKQRMDAMKVLSPQAYQYLVNVAPKEKWVMAYFSTHVQCDTQVNNICETFSSKNAEAREKAIITICGLDDHNRRTCQNGPQISTPQTRQPPEQTSSQRTADINNPSTSNPSRPRKKKPPVPSSVPKPRQRSTAQRCGHCRTKD
ncbi:hypothetical protein AAHA92_25572 [Salvia divinorum]|uniref:MULE transposase domain-containing protein n=1 Tax=Salvia divinorum TaxID=28513 RepID=A0ABD1GB32_SALDI